MKMQAALWYGPEDLRIEEVDVPKVGRGEVLVKIGAALTCGTDFKLFRKGHPFLARNIPAPFGHEMAGTIAEVGKGVDGFRMGDRVVAANSAPCGECFFCHREQPNLCEDLQFLTGAYAEYLRVPSRIVQKNLYKIPAELAFDSAAAAEPLACALHCFERAAVQRDETLAVIGAGPCGLFFVQLARLKGIRVICVGRGEEKLRVAERLGAGSLVSVEQVGFEERIREATEGHRGPDVVIESVGTPETWELAARLVRKGGRVWFYGGCVKGAKVSLDTHRIHYDELTMNGVFHHTPRHFKKALSLLGEGSIHVNHLISGERRLADVNKVFCKGVSHNPLKIAIIP